VRVSIGFAFNLDILERTLKLGLSSAVEVVEICDVVMVMKDSKKAEENERFDKKSVNFI